MSKDLQKEIRKMYMCFEMVYLEDYKITSKKMLTEHKKIRSLVAKKLKDMKEAIAALDALNTPANNLDDSQ